MPLDFIQQLHELGLDMGDTLMVHSSMKSLRTDKTPEEFVCDILSCIGPDGTLLVPAFSWNVNAENPFFYAKSTEPARGVGIIPRTCMYMPGVIRSLHPTHSLFAFGKRAAELTFSHIEDETPVGSNSPIMKMLNYSGKILFIGDILHTCTFMHGIEEIAGVPYVLEKERVHYVIESIDGSIIEKDMFSHDFRGWRQEYQRIKSVLNYPAIKIGKVGEANCYLIEMSALLEQATKLLKENPYYFVSDIRA